MPLRAEQLVFRHHEIHIMYEAFQRFVKGDPHVELDTIDGSSFDKASWSNLMSCGSSVIKHHEDVILTGHSFGGATAVSLHERFLETLHTDPPQLSLLATKPAENYQRIPISKVVVLDPWLEPLPTPGPVPYSPMDPSCEDPASVEASVRASLDETTIAGSNASVPKLSQGPPKLFVINSETFTLWKDHFARLQEIVATWEPQGRRIATLSKHDNLDLNQALNL